MNDPTFTVDDFIAGISGDVVRIIEQLPGKYYKIGEHAGHPVFRQASGVDPAQHGLFMVFDGRASNEGWYIVKSLDQLLVTKELAERRLDEGVGLAHGVCSELIHDHTPSTRHVQHCFAWLTHELLQ